MRNACVFVCSFLFLCGSLNFKLLMLLLLMMMLLLLLWLLLLLLLLLLTVLRFYDSVLCSTSTFLLGRFGEIAVLRFATPRWRC